MRFKDEDLKEIARLVDEGWSRNQVATKYNVRLIFVLFNKAYHFY